MRSWIDCRLYSITQNADPNFWSAWQHFFALRMFRKLLNQTAVAYCTEFCMRG